MRVTYDPAKRDLILNEREIDIADAGKVFAEFHLTKYDPTHSSDEDRFISIGLLESEVVIVVWTEREDSRRIVTMWKANEKERKAYHRQRDRPG